MEVWRKVWLELKRKEEKVRRYRNNLSKAYVP